MMMRFMRNRKKAKNNSSSEVATEVESGDAGAASGDVVLLGMKSTEQADEQLAVGEMDTGGASTGEALETGRGETSCVEDEIKMAAIPEETGTDEEMEHIVAVEGAYAYPEGDGGDDEASVITVIEKRQNGVRPEEEEPAYATVSKPTQRLRTKAEMLDDRYTPEKLEENNEPVIDEATADMNGKEEEEPEHHPPPPREEDFYIYVSEGALKAVKPRTSPISVEPIEFKTFDSPERQVALRDIEKPALETIMNNRSAENQRQAYLRQMSAPAQPSHHDPIHSAQYERWYAYDVEPVDANRRKEVDAHQRGNRRYDRAIEYENELDHASDLDYPPREYHEYDSDRSEYENFSSYDRRHAKRRDDPHMVIRYSASGGFIERTNSMPTIRHGQHSLNRYPRRSDANYRYHQEGRHRNRRRNIEHDPYQDSKYHHPPHDRHAQYSEPHQSGYAPIHAKQSNGHRRQPSIYPIRHGPYNQYSDREHSDAMKHPNQMNGGPKANGDIRHQHRESPACSTESTDSGDRKRDTRVSFKDVVDGDKTHFPETVKEDVADDCEKALLAKHDDDAVSLGSTVSDIDEHEARPRCLIIRQSIAIWCAWFCMGFFTEVVGPNITFLENRVAIWHNEMGMSLGARGVGILLGTAVGGLLCEVAPSFIELWISSSLILGALSTSAVPWSMSLTHLCLTLALSGFSKGFLQVATVTLTFRLWAKRSAMYVVFLIHMAYAVGAAPCAQLAFLFGNGVLEKLILGPNATMSSPEEPTGSEETILSFAEEQRDSEANQPGQILSLFDYIPRPMYPFNIAAILTFLCGAVFLAFFGASIRTSAREHLNKPKTPEPENNQPPTETTTEKPKPSKANDKCFRSGTCGVRGVLSYIIYFFLPMGIISIIGTYHHLYLASKASKSDPLLLQTIFWCAIAFGRLITPPIVRCVSPNGLTISCLTMAILSTTLLEAFGSQYPLFLWIFTPVLGTFIGPIIPAGLTVCSISIAPTALGVAAVFAVQAIGNGFFSWGAGFLLEKELVKELIYTAAGCAGAAFLLYLPVIPILARIQSPYLQQSSKKAVKGKAEG